MVNILDLDDYDLDEARRIAAAFGVDRFGYVVTPNVDHVIRYCGDAQFRELYAGATYIFLDSRFLRHIFGFVRRQRLRVCPGSDLAQAVFSSVIKPNDVAVLLGATAEQARQLRARFGLNALHHVEAPMNLLKNPAAIDACVREIETHSPFRFCFLAVGSPQQEIIAQKLQERRVAQGLALCVGASINYMTGIERRAPLLMQTMGLEWLFRLATNPRRLARRYLVRGPKIFLLLPRVQLRLRRITAVPGEGRDELASQLPPLLERPDDIYKSGVARSANG
jgi:exopolysaccharide biosynthesis WecB/TagA/CpsF family protein